MESLEKFSGNRLRKHKKLESRLTAVNVSALGIGLYGVIALLGLITGWGQGSYWSIAIAGMLEGFLFDLRNKTIDEIVVLHQEED